MNLVLVAMYLKFFPVETTSCFLTELVSKVINSFPSCTSTKKSSVAIVLYFFSFGLK